MTMTTDQKYRLRFKRVLFAFAFLLTASSVSGIVGHVQSQQKQIAQVELVHALASQQSENTTAEKKRLAGANAVEIAANSNHDKQLVLAHNQRVKIKLKLCENLNSNPKSAANFYQAKTIPQDSKEGFLPSSQG